MDCFNIHGHFAGIRLPFKTYSWVLLILFHAADFDYICDRSVCRSHVRQSDVWFALRTFIAHHWCITQGKADTKNKKEEIHVWKYFR